jgi:hypothetical protein
MKHLWKAALLALVLARPDSWADLFFPLIHAEAGS